MMNTKKIIGTSSAIIIAGVSMMSSVSAMMSMESTDGSMSMSSEAPASDTESTNMDQGNKVDLYAQCLAYVKLKNLTGVDCKAKTEAMRQENQAGRAQMNQGIKDDRMKMEQGIKDDRMKMQQENMQNRQQMGSGQMMHPPMGTGELKNFLKNPLTTEEQVALKALLQSQQAEHEAIMKDATLTPEQKATKMKELMSAHMTALLAYVNTDKQEAFKKMMEEKMAMMKKNQENRQEFRDGAKEQRQEFKDGAKEQRQNFNTQVQTKKQALSEKNKALLTKAVNSLSLEKLQSILAKVEKVLSVTKKEKVLAQLNEIADIVQNKIDELTGTSSEDDVVGSILGGDTQTTVTGTSTVTQ